jgi:hypothetical protein
MKRQHFLRGGLALLAGLVMASAARSYVLYFDDSGVYVEKWQSSSVTMQIMLPSTTNLSDGSSQRSSVASAMDIWNAQIGATQLLAQLSAPGTHAAGNKINEIAMDSTVDGDAFPTGVLAITLNYTSGNSLAESDITFNDAYQWDSYRGALRVKQDIRRVAIHELGHVLGLNHPDEAGQTVTAIMNSHVSSLDTLQADDITGGRVLYAANGFVPSNNAFSSAATITLSSDAATVTGSNILATKQAGEPSPAGSAGQHSVWWKWTSPIDGSLTLNTLGSDFDSVLGVYTGTSVSALTEIASNDDEETPEQNSTPTRKRTSKVAFNTTTGTTYWIMVDGWGSANDPYDPAGYTGNIVLSAALARVALPVLTSATTATVNVEELFSYQITATSSPMSFSASGVPAGLVIDTTTGVISGRPTATGVFAIAIGATNAAGTASGTLTLTVNAAAPVIVSGPPPLQVFQPGGNVVLAPDVRSANGTVTYQWMHNRRNISGATTSSLTLSNVSYADSGSYVLAVTNDIGTTYSLSFVHVVPANAQIVGWGDNTSGQITIPSGLYGALDVGVASRAAIALKRDGTVVQWGDASLTGTLPSGLANVASVAIGETCVWALRADGTVIGSTQAVIPNGLNNVVAIASLANSAIALKVDGTVVALSTTAQAGPTPPNGLTGVVSIAAGDTVAMALKSDGTVVAWNSVGLVSVPADLAGVAAIDAGAGHLLALKTDGSVVQWGVAPAGAAVPADLADVAAVAAGTQHSVALKADGTVVAWGDNSAGQSTVPAGLKDVFSVVAGGGTSFAMRDASADPSTSRLVNISARAFAGSGSEVAIVGFVTSGATPKEMLLRAVGPTLTSYNIPADQVLADPQLELHQGSGVVATNDDWSVSDNATDITSTATRVHAVPFAASDAVSSAMVATLDHGLYTFVVKGKNDTTGITLVEAYDADSAATDSVLKNLSARVLCKTGSQVAIGGFVIGGTGAKQVLLRALGPTLGAYGVQGNLQNPILEVHDATHGNVVIATNDDWGSNPNASDIVTTGQRKGATAFAESDTTSAALLLTLNPGVYSFVVSGVGGTSGVVLIEAYDAD